MTAPLHRRLVAEFLGAGTLTLIGASAIVVTAVLGGRVTLAQVGFIALAHGFALLSVIYVFGSISGAHINPAVTFALAVARRFPFREVGPYVGVQLAGASVGALGVILFAGPAAIHAGLGATLPAPGIGPFQAIGAEAVGTFLLMLAIMAVGVDPAAPKGWAGLVIGLTLAGIILALGPFTGASLNPSRTFGPYLVSWLFGGPNDWAKLPIYLVGPGAGAMAAAFTYGYVADLRTPPEEREEASVPTYP